MTKFLHVILAVVLFAGTAAAGSFRPAARTATLPDGMTRWDGEVTQSTATARSRAAVESMDFTYALDLSGIYSLNGTTPGRTRVFIAFEIAENDLAYLRGNKITSVNVMAGTDGNNNAPSNLVSTVNVFVSNSLSGTPKVKQSGKLSKEALEVNRIVLDTPYEITDADKTLYVGYYFTLPLSAFHYIPTDEVPVNTNSLLFATSTTDALPATSQWQSAAGEIGSVCLSCTVEGENLPANFVSIVEGQMPAYVKTGSKSGFGATIHNMGASDVSSIEFTTAVGDAASEKITVNLPKAIAPGEIADCDVMGVTFGQEGIVDLVADITAVNGEAVPAGQSVSGSVPVYTDGFDRYLVVEEGTGTWCGYCPAGIVMMEYIRDKYPERFYRIGVHYNDDMQITSYMTFINNYFSGFPCAFFNRAYMWTPTASTTKQFVDNVYDFYTSFPAYANVEFTGTMASVGNSVTVNATTEFSLSTDKTHYLSFAIVEDGVGPYDQNNYYAGSGESMGGWENKAQAESTMFDDVARMLNSYPGLKTAIPAQVKKGEKYNYSTKVSTSAVKGDKFRVIAMITNVETGEIVNASQIYMSKKDGQYDGVEEVNTDLADAPVITAANGSITIEGAKTAAVYTIDGCKVSDGNAHGLPTGIYIVVADGKSTKVVLK